MRFQKFAIILWERHEDALVDDAIYLYVCMVLHMTILQLEHMLIEVIDTPYVERERDKLAIGYQVAWTLSLLWMKIAAEKDC